MKFLSKPFSIVNPFILFIILFGNLFFVPCNGQENGNTINDNLDSEEYHAFPVRYSNFNSIHTTSPINLSQLNGGLRTYSNNNVLMHSKFEGVKFDVEVLLDHYLNYMLYYNAGNTVESDWDLYVRMIKYDPYATQALDPEAYLLFEELKSDRRNKNDTTKYEVYVQNASGVGVPVLVNENDFKAHIAYHPYSLATQLVYKDTMLVNPISNGTDTFHSILNIGDLCPENCPK